MKVMERRLQALEAGAAKTGTPDTPEARAALAELERLFCVYDTDLSIRCRFDEGETVQERAAAVNDLIALAPQSERWAFVRMIPTPNKIESCKEVAA